MRGKKGQINEVLKVLIELVLVAVVIAALAIKMSDVGKETTYEKLFYVRDIATSFDAMLLSPGNVQLEYNESNGFSYAFSKNKVSVADANQPTELASFYFVFAEDLGIPVAYANALPENSFVNKTKMLFSKSDKLMINTAPDAKFSCPSANTSSDDKKIIIDPSSDKEDKGIMFASGYEYEISSKIAKEISGSNSKTSFEIKRTREESPAAMDQRIRFVLDNPSAALVSIHITDDSATTIYTRPNLKSRKLACILQNYLKDAKIKTIVLPAENTGDFSIMQNDVSLSIDFNQDIDARLAGQSIISAFEDYYR